MTQNLEPVEPEGGGHPACNCTAADGTEYCSQY